jgi:hypothetical protein
MATDERNPHFQAAVDMAVRLLASSIAHYGFEQGANNTFLAKSVDVAVKLVDMVKESVCDLPRSKQ